MNFKKAVITTVFCSFMAAALNGCVIHVPAPGMEEADEDQGHHERSKKYDRHED